MTDAAAIDALAERFFAAMIGGPDLEGMAACIHPDAVAWHNFDRVTIGRQEALDGAKWFYSALRDARLVLGPRHVFAGGFVQEYVLSGRTPTGEAVEVPACVVADVKDGVMVRITEYADSAQLHGLTAGLTAIYDH